MQKKFVQFVNIIRADPAVAQWRARSAAAAAAGRRRHQYRQLFITLKPPAERGYVTTDDVIDRLRPEARQPSPARACS